MIDIKRTIWLWPVLSGLFLGSGFLFPVLRFLVWFGFIPLFFYLNSGISLKKSFRAGFWAGVFFGGQVVAWYFNTLPADWLNIRSHWIGFCFILLIWLISIAIAGAFFGLFCVGCRMFRMDSRSFLLAAPSLWIISEYLRAFGINLLLFGKDAALGPYWTFGHLGYLLSESPVLGILAGLGGIYLLSFIIAAFNAAFYYLLNKNNFNLKKILLIISLLIICFLISGYSSFYLKTDGAVRSLRVAVLNTVFSSRQQPPEKFAVLKDLLTEAADLSPQIIISPENSHFLANSSQEAKKMLTDLFPGKAAMFVDVARVDSLGVTKNRILFFDTKQGIIGYQDKTFLMPFGEYQPYIIKWPAKFIAPEWVERVNQTRGYSAGIGIRAVSFYGAKIGGLFCGDIISPDLYRELSRQSQIIFNVSDHSAFGRSIFLSGQIMAVSRVRAAENNRYLIMAANNDFSYIIDNGGRLTAVSKAGKASVLFGKAGAISKRTVYNRFGDWILIVAALILCLTKFNIRGIIYRTLIK